VDETSDPKVKVKADIVTETTDIVGEIPDSVIKATDSGGEISESANKATGSAREATESISKTAEHTSEKKSGDKNFQLAKVPQSLFGLLADIRLSVYVFVFASIVSCFSGFSYLADMFCQFRVQMAAGLAFMTLVQICFYKTIKFPKLLTLTILSLALNVVSVGYTTLPLPGVNQSDNEIVRTFNGLSPISSQRVPPQGKSLTLLQFNLRNNNREYAKFLDYVLDLKPDIICLEEYSSGWAANIAALKKGYPYEISKVREDPFGVAIFSRYPMQHQAILELGKARLSGGYGPLPSAYCQIVLDGKTWSILATHPLPPFRSDFYSCRNEQYRALAQFVKKNQADYFVLAGDLNCAPWSACFMNLLTASNLRDSRVGFALEPTWPANCWILRIPLDHVLTSKNIDTTVRRTGGDLGSDHLPVYVELLAK
jgi:endonuclease/exonuclease/phosphatase (EEP) superfamily protein YafD